ncbi:MAG: MBL fold metallo-hydrolase [Gammaproteobacteria bacterium]|nr:MAG: MBL fold metallo-hydrolase [Gammaproteobacteria bacterium]
MRFSSLGSGSKGNAALVESGTTSILIDCGFSVKQIETRLERLARNAGNITAILITHEHADHVSGLAALTQRYRTPVWITRGTFHGLADKNIPEVNFFKSHSAFTIGDINITPAPVPHDAREPTQFVFECNGKRLGVLSDVGKVTPHLERLFTNLDSIFIESNHCINMLQVGPYPRFLKERVGGGLGHLSNDQCVDFLKKIGCDQMQHIIAGHISEKNNCPQLVQTILSSALNLQGDRIKIASQDRGIGWCEVI